MQLRSLLIGVLSSTVVLAVPAPAGTPAASAEYTNAATLQAAIIKESDVYRKEHRVNILNWNSTLAAYAADWASQCKFQHSKGPYGENLATGFSSATLAVKAWGDERAKYNFSDPGFNMYTGHFTQLVWKGTAQTGCAAYNCGGTPTGPTTPGGAFGWFVVCEYYPPGNYLGQFEDNVLPRMA